MKPLATAVLGLAMRVVATTSIIMTPKMALSDVSFEAVPKVAIILEGVCEILVFPLSERATFSFVLCDIWFDHLLCFKLDLSAAEVEARGSR